MELLKQNKRIGTVHIVIQALILILFSGGLVFLALAEIYGWILLSLWISFNYLGIPAIVNIVDANFMIGQKKDTVNLISKTLIVGLIGGLLIGIFVITYTSIYSLIAGSSVKMPMITNLLRAISFFAVFIFGGELTRIILVSLTNKNS